MTTVEPSSQVRQLVHYIKSAGSRLETDELIERGIVDVLTREYEIRCSLLTREELKMLEDVLFNLAEMNEIREGQRKSWESFPEDRGTFHFSQECQGVLGKTSTYTMPYSYPVDENLRAIGKKKRRWRPARPQKAVGANGPKSGNTSAKAGLSERRSLKALKEAVTKNRYLSEAETAEASE